jgi:hypothetical protein
MNRNADTKRNLNVMTFQNEQFVSTRETMFILEIKSQTTICKYETEG